MLELHGLHKRYGEVVALDDASWTARPGRILGLLGPNGAGKTTSIRAIFGLVRLDAGTIRWDGAAVDDELRPTFGYLPEERGLYGRMPIGRQLAWFGRLHGLDADAARAGAARWLGDLGLADRHGARLDELSHGNQQRVQLAVALVHDPRLVVLDEPFNALDPLAVDRMGEVLRRVAAGGATVVFSSHQLDLVEALCDDVAILSAGRVVLAGDVAAVRADAPTRRVELAWLDPSTPVPDLGPGVEVLSPPEEPLRRLRVPRSTAPEEIVARARAAGELVHVAYGAPTLGELFREVVR